MMEIASGLVAHLPPDVDATHEVFNFLASFDAIARLRRDETGLEVLLEMTQAKFCPVLHFARHADAVAAMSLELDRLVHRAKRRRGRRTSGKCGFRRLA